jgi:hypothetical protein
LADFAATAPKPQSEVLMVTPDGDPLLSWWRYRRGIVLAMTSSGRRWSQWDGFDSFAAVIARHVVRQGDLSNVAVQLDQQGQTVRLLADARDADGAFINNAAASVELSRPENDQQELPQTAPGRYDGEIHLDELGRHDFEVRLTKDNKTLHETRRAMFADYPDEIRLAEVDESLLQNVARVTGGTYDANAEEIFADDGRRAVRTMQLGTYLLMAALVMFVGDVWLRRARFAAQTDMQ